MEASNRVTFLLLCCIPGLTGVPRASLADEKLDNAAWKYLTTLAPDQDIRVELKDRTKLKGKIQLLTNDGIVVHVAKTDKKLSRPSIQRILAKGESHRARNAAIAGLIGGPLALPIGAAIPTGGWEEIYCAEEAPPAQPSRTEEKQP